MSPNVAKMTPGRAAIAIAVSSVSSGVTQTGQPGPCTSSTSAGKARSIPNFIRLWVCPPQTSISVHGLVTVRRICSRSTRAGPAERYSSRYFKERPSLADIRHGRLPRLLRVQRLIQLRERREDLVRSFLVDQVESEPGVDDRVIANLRLRNERQANPLPDSAEGDDA